jgi:hypothetical protein
MAFLSRRVSGIRWCRVVTTALPGFVGSPIRNRQRGFVQHAMGNARERER